MHIRLLLGLGFGFHRGEEAVEQAGEDEIGALMNGGECSGAEIATEFAPGGQAGHQDQADAGDPADGVMITLAHGNSSWFGRRGMNTPLSAINWHRCSLAERMAVGAACLAIGEAPRKK